ncbi:DUF262 domain-containing protein [Nocardia sp. NPDC048505]|uniref:DUF262 domain-containing protein n=1 Tax=Nocardia sp. NPDC048505 TaxID=3155756 RepID=UPI0033E2508C
MLAQIDSGTLVLPEFQRGFVWTRDQVRRLVRSLYLNYPVGGLLVWESDAGATELRSQAGAGMRLLLLDGQQRITSLYSIIRGCPPKFFDGDTEMFDRLTFNVETEEFRFAAQHRDPGPLTVGVTDLCRNGVGGYLEQLAAHGERAGLYLNRLNRLAQITEREIPEQRLTDEHRDLDVVIDIFNQLNSSGTRLSKGDLALAKMCSDVPDARRGVRRHIRRWEQSGLDFRTDWLLRNITAVATGRVDFPALEGISAEKFIAALEATPGYVDVFLATLASQLGIPCDGMLPGRTSMPIACTLLHGLGGRFADDHQRDRALYWYMLSTFRGCYSSSTETVLNRDLAVLGRAGLDGLIESVDKAGESAAIKAADFDEAGRNARSFPILYMLAALGSQQRAVTPILRPIFPKTLLRDIGFPSAYVNAAANFFVIDSNVPGNAPAERIGAVLKQVEEAMPGTLAAQCIPQDENLWRIERYPEFLEERRNLLAGATQKLLDVLRG